MKYIKIFIFFILSLFPVFTFIKAIQPIRNDFSVLALFMSSAILAVILYALFEIMQSLKNSIEIREVCCELLAEYKDESMFIKTPIAYHHKFDKLEKLLTDEF